MKTLLCLILITGSSLALPQYGGNVQTDVEVIPQVEEISQKEVIPDLSDLPEPPVHDVHSERLEHSKDPKDPKTPKLSDFLEDPEDPQQSAFNKEQQEKLEKYWWKVSGVFGGADKDSASDTEHGVGVGGPFTPQQSKFCEVGFDCVPWEICVNGFIALHGQTILQQRIKPTNYETNQCGQEGNICCRIPEEVLAEHQESIGTIDVIDRKTETHQPQVDPQSPVDSVSTVIEHGESYDPSSPLETTKVSEEGKVDAVVPIKPVENVDPYEPVAPVDPNEPLAPVDPYEPVEPVAPVDPNEPLAPVDPYEPVGPVAPVDPKEPLAPVDPYEPVEPVIVDTNIKKNEEGNFDISINVEINPEDIKPADTKSENHADGEHVHTETGVGEVPISPVHTSSVIKNENHEVGGHGSSVPNKAVDPIVDPAVDPEHGHSSPLVDQVKVGNKGDSNVCGLSSLKCVPYFQCVDGVINVDGTGLIDVRIKPQSVCEHPDFPNVPGVCCRIPEIPIPQCPDHQQCLLANSCPSEGDITTDGRGQLDLRTGHKKCYFPAGDPGICCDRPLIPIETCPEKSVCVSKLECLGQALNHENKFIDYVNTGRWTHCSKHNDGVCCLQPERIVLDVCPGDSQCVEEKFCSGQALDGNKKFVDYVSGGTWSYCSAGNVNGICCGPQKPQVPEGCPGKAQCVLASQCSGQAIDESRNIVKYPSNGLWYQCSLGTSYGICCISSEPVILDKCPGKSLCLPGDQCSGQAIDESGKFLDYASGGTWSYCSLENSNGVCCIPPAPVIRETCPEDSICIIGNQCNGQALDGNNNFISYVPSGSWSYCSLNPENGVCCKALPSKIVDVCPHESVCLRPEQCIGKALNVGDKFVEYSKGDKWTHCSEYDGGVCCQNPQTPKDPGHLQPAPICGIRNYNIDERITSNKVPNEASFGEFPWQSIIFYQNYTFVCAATLVSNKFVITAAHCVDGIKPQDIKIRFGEWIVSNVEEVLPYVDRNVYKIHIHPEFNPKNVHKDLAVIELEAPVEFQYHINSVCIPNQGYMVEPYTQCFTSGWGKDSFEGSFQSTLKKIDLPFIEHEKCQNLLRRTRLGKYFRLDRSFNCAGGEENKDACYGDGGGPLVCKDKASSQYQLIGITSWGIGCGQKDIPGVYANVPEYSNWIKNIIKVQAENLPAHYKESFAPILEEPVQKHHEERHHEEGHHEEGHQEEGHQEEGHQEEGHQEEGHHKEGHQEEGQEQVKQADLKIEDIPEQVKQETPHVEEHIESIPETPVASYGK
ncbi:UNVERIFIED_CONTAM: hypothetical protein RMT77_000092 [Armadillidium vulgare]